MFTVANLPCQQPGVLALSNWNNTEQFLTCWTSLPFYHLCIGFSCLSSVFWSDSRKLNAFVQSVFLLHFATELRKVFMINCNYYWICANLQKEKYVLVVVLFFWGLEKNRLCQLMGEGGCHHFPSVFIFSNLSQWLFTLQHSSGWLAAIVSFNCFAPAHIKCLLHHHCQQFTVTFNIGSSVNLQ